MPFDPRVWREACSLSDHGYEVTVLCPRRKGCSRGYSTRWGAHLPASHAGRRQDSSRLFAGVCLCVCFGIFIYNVDLSAAWFRRDSGMQSAGQHFLSCTAIQDIRNQVHLRSSRCEPGTVCFKIWKTGRLYKVLLALEKSCYRHSDVVMATNESYRNMAISRGRLRPENVFVVRNGPDGGLSIPSPRIPRGRHGKRYLVGYVGNMNFQDGLDILLGIAKHVKDIGRRDVHFTCVGRGPELKMLQQMVRQMGLEDTVDFTGRVSDEDLIEILSTADVCVNPDRPSEMNDMSTMIKIMEYMALGKPIVQFDSKEGKFSAQEASLYASKQGGVADFADKIVWLLDRPEERKKMGEFGRKRVEEELAWEYSVPNLLAAYQQALRG